MRAHQGTTLSTQPLMSTTGGRQRASASDSCKAGGPPLAEFSTQAAMSARGRSNPILLASAVPFSGGGLRAPHPHMLGIDGRLTALGMQTAQAQLLP